jgi:hypothetical protein
MKALPMLTPETTPKIRRAGVPAKSSISSTRAWCVSAFHMATIPAIKATSPQT